MLFIKWVKYHQKINQCQISELSDDEWAEFLFMRENIKGVQFERWNHAHGCRKWFNIVRDTSNDKIHAFYKMGEKPPKE